MWGRLTHAAEADIAEADLVEMLRTIRQGDGVTSQILRNSRRVLALLGAADINEAVTILREATTIAPGDKYLLAAENALNLTASRSSLTQRRTRLIEEALRRNRTIPKAEAMPTTISGWSNWEDAGFKMMAAYLFRRMAPSNPDVAIGKLNTRIFALEGALQRERQLAHFRDERLQAALFETAEILKSLIEGLGNPGASEKAALAHLRALQQLYRGTNGKIRQLDLSGKVGAGLFEESLATQSFTQVQVPGQGAKQDLNIFE